MTRTLPFVTYTAAPGPDPEPLRNSGHPTGFRHVTGAEVLAARAVTKLTGPLTEAPLHLIHGGGPRLRNADPAPRARPRRI